jgi:hypothetical protein
MNAQVNQNSTIRASDFGAQLGSSDFRNSSIYLAIGLAEGTIGRDGKPTSAYAGHDDPGNHILNRGFGSYQVYQHPSGRGAGIGAQEADQIQADRLRKEAWPGIDKALNDAGFKPGPMRDLVAASALDAWNQAPGAVFGDSSGKRYSMMHPNQLADLKRDLDSGKSPQNAITEWRTEGYKRDDGSLAASGFNNSLTRLTDDQARRTAAVADGLSLRPTQAVSQTVEPSNPAAKPTAQNTPATPARDIGADIAETAKSWAGKSFKPGETERCQDFVNSVLNQTSPGLANKIGTTRQAQDGMESGEYLASRFSGNDVGRKIPVSEARPGDIVMFKNTYGDYPAGTITHVGIYVGDGMMVDRPTASKPVQMRSINTFGEDNVVVYRPHAYGQTQSIGKPDQGTPTTTSPAAPVTAQGMPMLREGDSGQSVRQLQETLNRNGAKLDVDGQFGPLTRAEVERYQRTKGLDADGIAGPKTWGALAQAQQQTPSQPVAAQAVLAATAGVAAATTNIATSVATPVTDRTLITHPDHPGHKWHEQALAIVDKLPQGTVSAENRDKAAALITLQVMDDQRLTKMAGVEAVGKGLIAVSDQQNVRAANSTVGIVNLNGVDGMTLRELSQQVEKLPEVAKREPQPMAPVAPTQDTQNLDPKRPGPVLIA